MIFETGKIIKYDLEKPTAAQDDLLYDYAYKVDTMYDNGPRPKSDEIMLRRYIKNQIKHHRDDHKLVLVDGKIVGLYLSRPNDEDGTYKLYTLFLEEEYRGLGIGSDLIKKDIEKAKKLKKDVTLVVFKENAKAFNLYKRLGFEIYAETDARYFMKLKIK